jgi:DNA invertase Pin-like site-specific DNA recombinase
MLTILGGVAGWERSIMLEGQREGIAQARSEGKYRRRAPTVAKQAAQIRAMVAGSQHLLHDILN